jgi:hypothetical protein
MIHGLIDPSGIRILAKRRDRMFVQVVSHFESSSTPAFQLPSPLGHYRRIHIHAWAQYRLIGGDRIEHDFHRDALHNFYVIAGGVLRRQQTQHRTGGPGNRINVAGKGLAVGVDVDFCLLASLHLTKLRFLKICGNPNILQRDDHQQTLALLHDLAGFDLFVGHNAIDRRHHFGVTQIQLSGFQQRARFLDLGHFPFGVGGTHAHLLHVRVSRLHRGSGLRHPGLRGAELRSGDVYTALGLR